MDTPNAVERRHTPHTNRPGGSRFRDDPMLVGLFDLGAQAIGATLYRYRECHGWSQEQLATAAGLSADTIDRMERGRSNFEFESFVRAFVPFGPRAFVEALQAAAAAYKRVEQAA